MDIKLVIILIICGSLLLLFFAELIGEAILNFARKKALQYAEKVNKQPEQEPEQKACPLPPDEFFKRQWL